MEKVYGIGVKIMEKVYNIRAEIIEKVFFCSVGIYRRPYDKKNN
ncbi:hypothetical protein SAMN02910276_02539 [Butyrivibrio sp. Su6]|nr:hypothetical protein SAMN02910276_02539 [Butyrivibrio sp. Su6]